MRSLSIYGTVGITSVMVPHFIQAWNAFIHNVGEIGRDAWLDKLLLALNVLRNGPLPVHVSNCIGCQERPGYHASLGVIRAKLV